MNNKTYLIHTGVKGMKWGVRRYQNEDGTLTREGKIRYEVDSNGQMSAYGRKTYDQHKKILEKNPTKLGHFENKYQKEYLKAVESGLDKQTAHKVAKGKVKSEQTLLTIGGITLGTLLVAGGATAIGVGAHKKGITKGVGIEKNAQHERNVARAQKGAETRAYNISNGITPRSKQPNINFTNIINSGSGNINAIINQGIANAIIKK